VMTRKDLVKNVLDSKGRWYNPSNADRRFAESA